MFKIFHIFIAPNYKAAFKMRFVSHVLHTAKEDFHNPSVIFTQGLIQNSIISKKAIFWHNLLLKK